MLFSARTFDPQCIKRHGRCCENRKNQRNRINAAFGRSAYEKCLQNKPVPQDEETTDKKNEAQSMLDKPLSPESHHYPRE